MTACTTPPLQAEEEAYALDCLFDIVETEPVAGEPHGVMSFRVKLARAAKLAGHLERVRGVLVTREPRTHSCSVQSWKKVFMFMVKHINSLSE